MIRNGRTFLGLAVAAVLCGSPAFADVARSTAVSPDGSTPLMQAAFEGNVAEARRLIAAGADAKAVNAYGVNAMQLAAEVSNTELVALLLKAGAGPDSPNLEGETALHLVARSGNVEAAKLLLKAGAAVDARENFGGQTPLMWAAARRHEAMVDLLASKGADVDARSEVRDYKRVATAESRAKFLDRGGLTPLMYAARENCRECVDVLLKHKVDVNLPDPSGMAPMSIAMMNGNWDIAKRLIEAGADVDQWDIYGQSPLHVAIGNLNSRGSSNPLDVNSPGETSSREIVKMLVERGANPNQQLYFRAPGRGLDIGLGRGLTPFLAACANGDIEIVKLLLANGANPKLATADAQGPIILAVGSRAGGTGNPGARFASADAANDENSSGTPGGKRGRARSDPTVELIKLLAEAGADLHLIAKRHFLQRTRGGSALHYAVRTRNKEVMAALVELGIDLNAKDEDGLTALDYAMGRGYVPFLQMAHPPLKDLADALRSWGATVELAKTPDWPPQGPPIGTTVYDAVIWPVDPVGP